MEFLEAAGFTHYWGYTPAIDFLSHDRERLNSLPEVNVFLSGCCDIRHILKSLAARLDSPASQRLNVLLSHP